MGLDVSHDCWSGSYSTFNDYRAVIAACIGIDLWKMDGFFAFNIIKSQLRNLGHGAAPGKPTKIKPNKIRPTRLGIKPTSAKPIPWDAIPPHPLNRFLNHSDCDGIFKWQECRELAQALEDLLPLLKSIDETSAPKWGMDNSYYQARTEEWIKGLRQAARLKEDVEFG